MALTDTGEVNQMAVPLESGVTCGQALVKLLANYGVDTVFGIPGVHTLELYRGLPGSPIRHVLARHEQGAGFMADGYARVSGKPGVCFIISGPMHHDQSATGEPSSSLVVPLPLTPAVDWGWELAAARIAGWRGEALRGTTAKTRSQANTRRSPAKSVPLVGLPILASACTMTRSCSRQARSPV